MKAIHIVKTELSVKHDKEKRAMKESNQALKEALVARDHFKAMSDHELVYCFEEIGNEIREFAQVIWEKRQESSWPFPDRLFQRCENKRRMKEHVLLNTIWVILHENIFCTPFRVFGKDGKDLEEEWAKKFDPISYSSSASVKAPKASKESEKWRYESIQEYVEATEQGRGSSENIDVKKGFDTTLETVTDEISRHLVKVATFNSTDKERLRELVHGAANLWLEVGQQRCRMFLVMSQTDKEPKRSAQSSLNRDGTMDLVVMPGLKRIGNAQGGQLDRIELIVGCKGDFSRFPC